jgi:hypothetical protein
MTYRLAKKRTLQKAGFVHVSGWVSQDDHAEITKKIQASEPKVQEALKNEQ